MKNTAKANGETHGTQKGGCGVYKCLGKKCKGQNSKQKSLAHFQNRPTAEMSNLIQNPIVKELAINMGPSEEARTVGLAHYEKIYSAWYLHKSPKLVPKEDIKEALLFTGFKDKGNGVFERVEELTEAQKERNVRPDVDTFNFNDFTFDHKSKYHDPGYDSYQNRTSQGRSALLDISQQLSSHLKKEFGLKQEIDKVDNLVRDYEREQLRLKREQKYNEMPSDKYLGQSFFFDRMRDLKEKDPTIQERSFGSDRSGFKINNDTYIVDESNYFRGNRKDSPPRQLAIWRVNSSGTSLNREGFLPMTKKSLETIFKDSSQKALEKHYLKKS